MKVQYILNEMSNQLNDTIDNKTIKTISQNIQTSHQM